MKYTWLIIFIAAIPILTLVNGDELLANFGYLLFLFVLGTIISAAFFGILKLINKKPFNPWLVLNIGAGIMAILPVVFFATNQGMKSLAEKDSKPAAESSSKYSEKYVAIPPVKILMKDKTGKEKTVRISASIELSNTTDKEKVEAQLQQLNIELVEAISEYDLEELASYEGKTALSKNILNRVNSVTDVKNRSVLFSVFAISSKY